jgi:hypothetical protein
MPYTRKVQVVPLVESGKTYAPDEFAFQVQNLQRTSDGTLAAVRGPCGYTPFTWTSNMYGVYHAMLDQGMRDVLLVRSGDTLYEQTGWSLTGDAFNNIHGDLTETASYKYPDQFCEVGGRIIWTNGIDSPLVYDGYIKRDVSFAKLMTLGYDRAPNAPTVLGPSSSPNGNFQRSVNDYGYSHPGNVGTISSDLAAISDTASDSTIGLMLEGNWNYAVQFEDAFGNLSPWSAMTSVRVLQEQTKAKYFKERLLFSDTYKDLGDSSVTYSDLQRQFWIDGITKGPDGTVARRILRSADTLHRNYDMRLLARIPDNVTTCWPDETADALLGHVAQNYLPTPTFKVMTPFSGGLAVANTLANPGIVHFSDPGFPGSFRPERFIYPDPNGHEITGLAVFDGRLLAFTTSNVYAITENEPGVYQSVPVTNGIGCVAPSSIVSTGWGELVWLGRDGFYSYDGEKVQYISDAIEDRMRLSNTAKLSRSVAVYNPTTREYLCAVPLPGSNIPNYIFTYDGIGWREQNHNRSYRSLCVTRDDRKYVLAASEYVNEDNVVVLDHETRDYASSITSFRYKSRWLKIDGAGLTRFNAATIYIGFLESSSAKIMVNAYRNGRWDEIIATGELTLMADDRPGPYSTSVIGTAKALSPRLFWRRFDMHLRSVDSFAFELVGQPADGEYLHIAAFAFDGVVASERGARIMKG